MKRIITGAIILIFLMQYSCIDEVSVSNFPKKNTGKLILKSDPDSADIFLLGTDIDKITPDSVTNLQTGEYNVTLKKQDYADTTFVVRVLDKSITLSSTVLKSLRSIVLIDSEPRGAEIFLSGKTIGKFTPDSLTDLDHGRYFITLKKEDYLDTTFSVELSKSERAARDIVLKETKFGSLFVGSQPGGAWIFLFDDNTGKVTPDSITNLIEGSYNMTLSLDGYKDTTFSVNVKKNKTANVDVTLTVSNTIVNVDLTYMYNQFNQIIFNFHFDRDIRLNLVEVLKPDSTDASTFDFDNSFIVSGDERIIVFTEALEGVWTFTFYGSAAGEGIAFDFTVVKEIEVD